jgi:hypothetical protein
MSRLRFVREERQNIPRLHAANFNALHAAVLTAEDSNSGFRRFQKSREVLADGFIGPIFDRGSLDSDFKRTLDYTGNFIATRARLDANLKQDAVVAVSDVELLACAGSGDETIGLGWVCQDATRRVGIARVARSLCAVPGRRVAASRDRAKIRVLKRQGRPALW